MPHTSLPQNKTESTLELENEHIHAQWSPVAGGRMISLMDKVSKREWLWRNTNARLESHALGASYDDVWSGGFDELFPNDLAEKIEGVDYPDHGEMWSQKWTVRAHSKDRLHFELLGPTTGCRLEKTYSLSGAGLDIEYKIENIKGRSFPYLFKLHAAIAIQNADRIVVPDCKYSRVDAEFSAIEKSDGWQEWPGVNRLDQCRAQNSKLQEFVYLKDLRDGYCGIRDSKSGRSVRLLFSLEEFPYCWLFMTYGGWRDHQVVVLEPCTGYPKSIHQAIQDGIDRRLDAGERISLKARIEVGNFLP